MAQILVGATIVGSIETVWSGTVTPPREGVIKRWTYPAGDQEGSVALLKGQEMGRFKLGSTVINLFAPGKVKLVDALKNLSVTKLGEPLAISTEAVVEAEAVVEPTVVAEPKAVVEPAVVAEPKAVVKSEATVEPATEQAVEHNAVPKSDDKKEQS